MAAAPPASHNRPVLRQRDAVEPISVIFVDMPRMVREIVKQAVESQADMVVVAELETPADAIEALDTAAGSVVLVGDSGIGADDVERLLTRAPGSSLLAVSAAGGQVDVFQLQPVRRRLGEASPRRLVEAIRSAARREDGGRL